MLINKTLWLHEFAPAVQEEFLRLHPEYQETQQRTGGIGLVTVKIIVCLVFVVILSCMAYIAGDRDFASAFCKCYIVWSAVNWFDVFVLDLGILAHWKKSGCPAQSTWTRSTAPTTAKASSVLPARGYPISLDLLRAGSKLAGNQYCMPVLGLIFLCYAYIRFKPLQSAKSQTVPAN